MKHFLLLLSLSLWGAALGHSPAALAQTGYDAMVVLRVSDLGDEDMAALSRQLGKQQQVTLEYSCTWSGVLVMKLSGIPVNERADVITLARRQLVQAGVEKPMEVLHVHVEARGTGKC